MEKFGTVEVGKEKQKGKGRRERETQELRQRVHQVRMQWRKSDDPDEKLGLSQLRDDHRSRLALLRKAERRRKMRKAKRGRELLSIRTLTTSSPRSCLRRTKVVCLRCLRMSLKTI